MYFKVEEGFKLSTLEFLHFLPRKNLSCNHSQYPKNIYRDHPPLM